VAAMDLLRQRIMRLTAEAQSLLHLAALAGREVDVDLLIAASGAGEDQVLEALDSAVAQGVLTGSASELRFTHDLMLETVRETLRPVQRARLHSRILAALERSPVPDIFALADHAGGAAALDPAAAARWAVAAADLSERRLAYDDAVKWWRRLWR
jgi:predicted ATPase